MNCYLCGIEAQRTESLQAGECVTCRDCGVYEVSPIVLKGLTGKQISCAEMREDFHRQRQVNATLVAQITSENVVWGQSPASLGGQS